MDIDILCICGKELEVIPEKYGKTLILEVEPCEDCMQEAIEEAKEDNDG